MKKQKEGTVQPASKGFRVHPALLKQAIKKVVPVANGKNNVLPVVSGNVHVSVNGNEAEVYATDLSTSAAVKIPVLRLQDSTALTAHENATSEDRGTFVSYGEDEDVFTEAFEETDSMEVQDAKPPRYKSKKAKPQPEEEDADVLVDEDELVSALEEKEFEARIAEIARQAMTDPETLEEEEDDLPEDEDWQDDYRDDEEEVQEESDDDEMPFAGTATTEQYEYEDRTSEFSILLPLEALPVLDALNCAVTVTHEDSVVTIATDQGSKYRFFSGDTSDYPTKQRVLTPDFSVTIAAEVLQRTVKAIAFAVGEDMVRPAMTGIYFEPRFESIRLVATNAHILAYKTIDAIVEQHREVAENKPLGVIIPPVAFKLLATSGAPVRVSWNFDNGLIELVAGDVRVRCQACEGKYPDYQCVVPRDLAPVVVNVGKSQLLATLRRAKALSDPATKKVVMELIGDEMKLICSSFGDDSPGEFITMEESMKVNIALHENPNYRAEDVTRIGFNAEFLYNIIQQTCSDETVSISLYASNRAALLNANEKEVALIMPVMVS